MQLRREQGQGVILSRCRWNLTWHSRPSACGKCCNNALHMREQLPVGGCNLLCGQLLLRAANPASRPSLPAHSNAFVRKVFGIVTLQLLVTAGIAAACMYVPEVSGWRLLPPPCRPLGALSSKFLCQWLRLSQWLHFKQILSQHLPALRVPVALGSVSKPFQLLS